MAQKIAGTDPDSVSSLTLAYIGDSVFELNVRSIALERHNGSVNDVNAFAKKYSRASAQAKMALLLEGIMDERELRIFKRGRNAKSVSAPHTCSISEYRRATGLEALAGYLYLEGNIQRAAELIEKGIELMEETEKSEGCAAADGDLIRRI
mgnify:CR=1 FL=1